MKKEDKQAAIDALKKVSKNLKQAKENAEEAKGHIKKIGNVFIAEIEMNFKGIENACQDFADLLLSEFKTDNKKKKK